MKKNRSNNAATRKITSHAAHPLQHVLARVATSTRSPTKKSISAALRAAGAAGTPANVEEVLRLRDEFECTRRNRMRLQAENKLGHPVMQLARPTGRPAIALPAGQPLQRLDALRKSAVVARAKQVLRYGAPGGATFIVTFATTADEVDYDVILDVDYDVYGGAFKGWAANADRHRIRVPRDWRLRVERRGLAVLGGMLTLDALQLEAPAGIRLYAATWAAQGRGYQVKTERGYIALNGEEHFHAKSAQDAVAGLARKCGAMKRRREILAELASPVDHFIEKYAGLCDVVVSLEDARKTGSCEYGIRSWCNCVGIDIARVQVPLTEILAGLRQRPMTEVRRAVLRAVRQARR